MILSSYRAARRLEALAKGRKLCRQNCGRLAVNGGPLCQSCRRTMNAGLETVEEDAREVRPERQPGDAHYRCLLCMRWRCSGPLQRCEECHAEYERMAAGMPANKHVTEVFRGGKA